MTSNSPSPIKTVKTQGLTMILKLGFRKDVRNFSAKNIANEQVYPKTPQYFECRWNI